MTGMIEVTLKTPFVEGSPHQKMAEALATALRDVVSLPKGTLGGIVDGDRIRPLGEFLEKNESEELAHFGASLKAAASGCTTVVLDQHSRLPEWGIIIRRRINIVFDDHSYPTLFAVDHEIVDGFGDYQVAPDILMAETLLVKIIAACYQDWCEHAVRMFSDIEIAPIQHHVLGKSFNGGQPLMQMAGAIGVSISRHEEDGVRQIGPFLCAAGFENWVGPAPGASDAASLRLRALGASITVPMELGSRSTRFGADTAEIASSEAFISWKRAPRRKPQSSVWPT